jgi:hypothetical protein
MRSDLRLSRCKSDKAALPQKTLKLNITSMFGSSRSTDVSDASQIWERAANIKFSPNPVVAVNEADTKAAIGDDLILDEFTAVGSPTPEEVAMTQINRTDHVITAYFVKALSHGSHGEAFYSSGFPTVPPSVAIKDGDSPFVAGKPLAHELGHMLLDEGSHPSDVTNLMSYSHDGVSLNATQVSTSRGSSFVT